MPDSERLQQLQHQRALVAQHLRWLDQQIAQELAPQFPATFGSTASAPPQPPDLSPALTVHPQVAEAPLRDDSDIESTFEQLVEEETGPQVSKSGCWLIFAAVLLVVVGCSVWAIYAHYR